VRQQRHRFIQAPGSRLTALALCLLPMLCVADNTNTSTLQFGNGQHLADIQPQGLLPLQKASSQASLSFDLGDSETQKLAVQLSRPLTLDIGNQLLKSASGIGSVFLDSSLNLHLSDKLDITSSLGAGKVATTFKPLGSIHCQNGVLEKGSYRASDCYFINQANVLQQDQVALGLRYRRDNLNTSVSMFQRQTGFGQRGVVKHAAVIPEPVLGSSGLFPGSAHPLPSLIGNTQALQYLGSETSGLDMEFQVGLTTDGAGDVLLGIQLTRVLDASYETTSSYTPGLQNWTIANPFDSAKIDLGWSKGNFSGGIRGFYREQVQFLNREDLESSTTFDVHFTWRAPWNANLSVGTSNVLNAGSEDKSKTDNKLRDPFESVYGRIPYVRYQQDL